MRPAIYSRRPAASAIAAVPLDSSNGALRLPTARYFTPSGRSIQAKGITPDIEVRRNLPNVIKAQTDTSYESDASWRGHLKGDDDKEQTGTQSYIPPDRKDDKPFAMVADLLRGVNAVFLPRPNNVSIAVPKRRRGRLRRGLLSFKDARPRTPRCARLPGRA